MQSLSQYGQLGRICCCLSVAIVMAKVKVNVVRSAPKLTGFVTMPLLKTFLNVYNFMAVKKKREIKMNGLIWNTKLIRLYMKLRT